MYQKVCLDGRGTRFYIGMYCVGSNGARNTLYLGNLSKGLLQLTCHNTFSAGHMLSKAVNTVIACPKVVAPLHV